MNRNQLPFIVTLLLIAKLASAQDSTKPVHHFSGAVSVTNNGISVIPTFTLGKPAAIINLSMGSERFSFEPEMRFSLEGRPWSFIFWGRYKLVNKGSFRLTAGAHPALNFKTIMVDLNGKQNKMTVASRYVAAELSPRYIISKKISIGLYYLYAKGLDKGTTKNTNFVTLNASISHINLTKQFFLNFTPQFYYLKMDQNDGFYVTGALTVARKNFPFTLTGVINQAIQTEISQPSNFVWNLSLVYAFGKKYVRI
jgi:hypothetical protein